MDLGDGELEGTGEGDASFIQEQILSMTLELDVVLRVHDDSEDSRRVHIAARKASCPGTEPNGRGA
jgi:hypothetical protein